MKTKPIMEQLDRFEQRLTLHLETENGAAFDPTKYIRELLKTQSLEAWNGRSDDFQKWIAAKLCTYAGRVQVQIWGHGKEIPKRFNLVWSPEGKTIATVTALNIREAKKQTPKPYRKYLGEVYAQEVQP